MVNFFSVCTFFPAAVLFYDHYLKSTPFFFGLFTKLKIKAVTTLRERKLCKCLVGVEEPKSEVRLSIMDDNLPPPPPTLSFFKHTYSPFIFKYRMLILALFLCLWGVFAVGALMIKATPLEIHELFPKVSERVGVSIHKILTLDSLRRYGAGGQLLRFRKKCAHQVSAQCEASRRSFGVWDRGGGAGGLRRCEEH